MKCILKALGLALGLSVTGLAAPTSGPAGTFIVNTSSVANRQEFSVYKATVTNLVAFPFLTAGQCLTTNAAGQIAGVACGSGSANVAVTTGTAAGFSSIASSPTAVINFDSNTFTANLEGASTVYVGLLNAFLTTSSSTATYLQLSSATVTYLQNSSATATYLQSSSAAITYIQVSTTLAVAHGGTGTSSPGLIAGTNITSITGSWPNQTINATTNSGNFVQANATSLQSGATFYVSSGTVINLFSSKPIQEADSSSNVGYGISALLNTTGVNDTCIGYACMSLSMSGLNNTGGGYNACGLLGSGSGDTCFGSQALYNISSSNDQTSMGASSLFSSNGAGNTAFGSKAGYGVSGSTPTTTGTNNTFLGYNTTQGAATQLSNAVAIGANAVVLTSNTIQMGGTGANAASVNMSTFTASSGTVSGAFNTPFLYGERTLVLGHNSSSNDFNLTNSGNLPTLSSLTNFAQIGENDTTNLGFLKVCGLDQGFSNYCSGFNSGGTQCVTGSNVQWTLPCADSSGFMKSDGSAHLSLATLAASDMSALLSSSSTWTGQNNWTTPAQSTFTYGVTFGSVTFSSSTYGIVGTTLKNDAHAGFVGEYIQATFSNENIPASGTRADMATLTISAGDWDMWGNIIIDNTAGATITSTEYLIAITGEAGNASTDEVFGVNVTDPLSAYQTSYRYIPVATPGVRVQSDGTNEYFAGKTVSGSQVMRFKLYSGTYSGAQPVCHGVFRGRRVR